MTAQPPSSGGEVRRLIGRILLALGAIWMTLSGLCSGAFLITMQLEDPHFQEIFGIFLMIFLVGGFSVGIGFVVYIIGRGLAK